MAIVYNLGALSGGIFFGAVSGRIGRRRAIALAAHARAPAMPLWAYASTAAMFAVGWVRHAVHDAGGVGRRPGAPQRAFAAVGARDPARLRLPAREPRDVQDGALAGPPRRRHGNDYARVLAWTMGVVAVVLVFVTLIGREAKDAALRVE
jgi:SHS family lactate transporter-like MFS transporter